VKTGFGGVGSLSGPHLIDQRILGNDPIGMGEKHPEDHALSSSSERTGAIVG
jgi:hypothetical protein